MTVGFTNIDQFIQRKQLESLTRDYICIIKMVFALIFLMISVVCAFHHNNDAKEVDRVTASRLNILLILLAIALFILHFRPSQYSYIVSLCFGYVSLGMVDICIATDTPHVHEYVMSGFGFIYTSMIILPVQWKSNCFIFFCTMVYFLHCKYMKDGELPTSMIIACLSSCLYFFVSATILYSKLKFMYTTIWENEELVKEKHMLLEMFPNGVLIMASSCAKDRKIMFMNNEFENQISNIKYQAEALKSIKVIEGAQQSNVLGQESSDLYSYLRHIKRRLDEVDIIEDNKLKIYCRQQSQIDSSLLRYDESMPDHREEDERIFNVKSMQVQWEGKKCCMHVFIDNTDLVKLEEANNNIKCQKIMFTSVSHEFRTPLNAIINSYSFVSQYHQKLVSIIQESKQECNTEINNMIESYSEKIDKFIKMGSTSSILLLGLVEDILDLSKMEAGTFEVNITTFKIGELIDDVYNLFNVQCQQKGILLVKDIKPEAMCLSVSSDQGRLKQVLLNIISNSLKFTFKGKIFIHVKVGGGGSRGERYLHISISDTGIGIKPEDQPKLFKLFGMIESNSTINPNGCGIGLTISKKYIEHLGGTIQLRSQAGVGTIIEFTLPVTYQPQNAGVLNVEVQDCSSLIADDSLEKCEIGSIVEYSRDYKKLNEICLK